MPRNKDIIAAEAAKAAAPAPAPAPAPAAPAPAPAAPKAAAPAAPVAARAPAQKPKPASKPQAAKPSTKAAPTAMTQNQYTPYAEQVAQRDIFDSTKASPLPSGRLSTGERIATWRIGRSAEERAGKPQAERSTAEPGAVRVTRVTEIPAGALIPSAGREGRQSSPGVIAEAERAPGDIMASGYFAREGAMTPAEYKERKRDLEDLNLTPSPALTPEQARRMSETAMKIPDPELRREQAKARAEQEIARSGTGESGLEQLARVAKSKFGGTKEPPATVRPAGSGETSEFYSGLGAGAGLTAGLASGVKAAWPKTGMVFGTEGLPSVLRTSGLRGVAEQALRAGAKGAGRGAGWSAVAAETGNLLGKSLELSPDEVAVPVGALIPRPFRPELFAEKIVPDVSGYRPGSASLLLGEEGQYYMPRQIRPEVYEDPALFERTVADYTRRYRDQLRRVEMARGPDYQREADARRLSGAKFAQVQADPRLRAIEPELAKLATLRAVLIGELGYTAEDLNRLTP